MNRTEPFLKGGNGLKELSKEIIQTTTVVAEEVVSGEGMTSKLRKCSADSQVRMAAVTFDLCCPHTLPHLNTACLAQAF